MRKLKEVFRLIFSIIFLMGSIANLLILMKNPGLYSTFADLSLLEVYKTAWTDFVLPNLNIAILAVATFELVLAFLIASKEWAAKAGLILAMVFMAFLFPFWWKGGAIINIFFAVILFGLARFEYPVSLNHHFINVVAE